MDGETINIEKRRAVRTGKASRVLPKGGDRRLSIPFFHNANWDARIECIVTDDAPARDRA